MSHVYCAEVFIDLSISYPFKKWYIYYHCSCGYNVIAKNLIYNGFKKVKS